MNVDGKYLEVRKISKSVSEEGSLGIQAPREREGAVIGQRSKCHQHWLTRMSTRVLSQVRGCSDFVVVDHCGRFAELGGGDGEAGEMARKT